MINIYTYNNKKYKRQNYYHLYIYINNETIFKNYCFLISRFLRQNIIIKNEL